MALGPGPVIRSGSPLGERERVQGDACAPWSGLKKIAFRFAFVYFGLCNLSTALYLLAFPPFTQLYLLLEWLQWTCVLWVSKDTTFAYVSVFCFLVIAAITTIVWSLWDRKRRQYVWLHRWFLVYLRLS